MLEENKRAKQNKVNRCCFYMDRRAFPENKIEINCVKGNNEFNID